VIYPGTENPIADLFPHKSGGFITRDSEAAAHALLRQLNQAHATPARTTNGWTRASAATNSPHGMQLAAPEALDLAREPDYILDLYGIDRTTKVWPKEINAREEMDYFGRKCLTARRLLERGVRFVQIWSATTTVFPAATGIHTRTSSAITDHWRAAMARGATALIHDLKQRGLLEDTVILWTTEFGRMPSTQAGKGRDHNPYVFTTGCAAVASRVA